MSGFSRQEGSYPRIAAQGAVANPNQLRQQSLSQRQPPQQQQSQHRPLHRNPSAPMLNQQQRQQLQRQPSQQHLPPTPLDRKQSMNPPVSPMTPLAPQPRSKFTPSPLALAQHAHERQFKPQTPVQQAPMSRPPPSQQQQQQQQQQQHHHSQPQARPQQPQARPQQPQARPQQQQSYPPQLQNHGRNPQQPQQQQLHHHQQPPQQQQQQQRPVQVRPHSQPQTQSHAHPQPYPPQRQNSSTPGPGYPAQQSPIKQQFHPQPHHPQQPQMYHQGQHGPIQSQPPLQQQPQQQQQPQAQPKFYPGHFGQQNLPGQPASFPQQVQPPAQVATPAPYNYAHSQVQSPTYHAPAQVQAPVQPSNYIQPQAQAQLYSPVATSPVYGIQRPFQDMQPPAPQTQSIHRRPTIPELQSQPVPITQPNIPELLSDVPVKPVASQSFVAELYSEGAGPTEFLAELPSEVNPPVPNSASEADSIPQVQANPWGFFLEDNPVVDPKDDEKAKKDEPTAVVFEADSIPVSTGPFVAELGDSSVSLPPPKSPVVEASPKEGAKAETSNADAPASLTIRPRPEALNLQHHAESESKSDFDPASASYGRRPSASASGANSAGHFLPFRPGASSGPSPGPSTGLSPNPSTATKPLGNFHAYSPGASPGISPGVQSHGHDPAVETQKVAEPLQSPGIQNGVPASMTHGIAPSVPAPAQSFETHSIPPLAPFTGSVPPAPHSAPLRRPSVPASAASISPPAQAMGVPPPKPYGNSAVASPAPTSPTGQLQHQNSLSYRPSMPNMHFGGQYGSSSAAAPPSPAVSVASAAAAATIIATEQPISLPPPPYSPTVGGYNSSITPLGGTQPQQLPQQSGIYTTQLPVQAAPQQQQPQPQQQQQSGYGYSPTPPVLPPRPSTSHGSGHAATPISPVAQYPPPPSHPLANSNAGQTQGCGLMNHLHHLQQSHQQHHQQQHQNQPAGQGAHILPQRLQQTALGEGAAKLLNSNAVKKLTTKASNIIETRVTPMLGGVDPFYKTAQAQPLDHAQSQQQPHGYGYGQHNQMQTHYGGRH